MSATGIWSEDRFEGLPARVLYPDGYGVAAGRRWPLVVFLHGSGERGDDNRAQLRHGVEGFASPTVRARHAAIVVAPQCPRGTTWGGSWYGGPTATQEAVLGLTRDLATRATVDADRLYLAGISMGAIGGFEILARTPGLFAAGLLVCGEPDLTQADALRRTPIWALHGSDDEAVRPAPTRALVRALTVGDRPHRLRYTELPGVGHDAWNPVFADPAVYDWLFAQRRGA